MKIEIRKTDFASPVMQESNYREIYITRRQFMVEYELDRTECIGVMQQIAEMYTSPHCFVSRITEKAIDGIYKYFSEHKTSKGVVFHIVEVAPNKCDLEIYLVK
jgi:hypothetical protein